MAPAGQEGIGAFHVHRGHALEGFELVGDLLVARCDCGETLDVADAAFARCDDCGGTGGHGCRRCGGTGFVIDHAALEWRAPDES